MRMMHLAGPILGALALAPAAAAQNFASGSDGSYGAINITNNTTLQVPPSGVFNCTTITVAQFRILTFTRNAVNSPVYLLATGDVAIAGTIDVSGSQGNSVVGGLSGPGGFDGGSPGSISVPPGAGYGPGAGLGGTPDTTPSGAGSGSYAVVGQSGSSTNKGAIYGSPLLIPMIGGSGGGGTTGTPGTGGGGGGGAILISSSTHIDLGGAVLARPGSDSSADNSGSGGAVRLVAPIVTGGGRIDASGIRSGDGRIRVDATDRSQMGINFFPAATTSIGSLMQVFANPLPRLDITQAAGTAIPLGSGPATILLPFGSSPNRTVTVQASNFGAQVPITVLLTPDHGTPSSYTATIDNSGANNPALATVPVVVPLNEQTRVTVFSK